MGPQQILEMFRVNFEEAPEPFKYATASFALMKYQDALAKLNCSTEICDDLDDRKAAAQYMIDYVTTYLTPGSGGHGGGP